MREGQHPPFSPDRIVAAMHPTEGGPYVCPVCRAAYPKHGTCKGWPGEKHPPRKTVRA